MALGQRLFWHARGPWQVFPHCASTGESSERRTSWSENPADPNSPALFGRYWPRSSSVRLTKADDAATASAGDIFSRWASSNLRKWSASSWPSRT